jgi:hypothetical protein
MRPWRSCCDASVALWWVRWSVVAPPQLPQGASAGGALAVHAVAGELRLAAEEARQALGRGRTHSATGHYEWGRGEFEWGVRSLSSTCPIAPHLSKMYTHACAYIYVCVYIFICIYIHVYMHICIYMRYRTHGCTGSHAGPAAVPPGLGNKPPLQLVGWLLYCFVLGGGCRRRPRNRVVRTFDFFSCAGFGAYICI